MAGRGLDRFFRAPRAERLNQRILTLAEWEARRLDPSLMPGHFERSPAYTRWLGWPFYGAALVFFAGQLPLEAFDQRSARLFLILGTVAIWRWSWSLLHFLRALAYRFIVFPRLRRRAATAQRPLHLYFLVTSYRMAAELNALVYRRLLEEIVAHGVPATIVAAITDAADMQVIGALFERCRGLPEGSKLVFVPQRGTGKREAMATGLKIIAGEKPLPGSFVVLMDGDSVLGPDALARTAAILMSNPDVGAATTENIPWVKGGVLAREWYRLRMAHRASLMCSLSLSRKLLVLTGRFSMFRAEIAVQPDFILGLEQDVVRHWRLGTIEMLTGDDKSTWFTVLRRGWNMLYVPDALVHPVEALPETGFVAGSAALMARWYGNMTRNSARSIALGPRRCGLFLWLCLIDQRLSMWTALYGPTVAITASLLYGPRFLHFFILWILVSRGITCLMLYIATGRAHPIFPFLLYYHQLVGSLIKIHAFFHPYQQRWTRQAIEPGQDEPLRLLRSLTSGLYNAIILLLLLIGTVGLSGVLLRSVGTDTGYSVRPLDRDMTTGSTLPILRDDPITGTSPPGVR